MTALGYAGRVGEALTAIEATLQLIVEEGEQAARFTSIFLNARGWLLRNLGLHEAADAANMEALEHIAATMPRMGEPYHVAHLDLLDGALARNDAVDTSRWLAQALPIATWDGTMSWRQQGRLDLLRARIALRDDDPMTAMTLATSVRDRAATWGVPRYQLLAELVMDEVAAGAGQADAGVVADRLQALGDVAAPEAWWRTAEMAVALDDGGLAADAEARAAPLVADAASAGIDAASAVADRLAAIRARRSTRDRVSELNRPLRRS
ncbi:MAG: hypothetical protein WKF43_04095 [Acidimicrobiales bacterium]